MAYCPLSNHTHLWNELPEDVRKKLAPYMIEAQILHIWQVQQAMIRAHKSAMKEIDDWIENCEHSLRKKATERS